MQTKYCQISIFFRAFLLIIYIYVYLIFFVRFVASGFFIKKIERRKRSNYGKKE